LFNLIIRNFCC